MANKSNKSKTDEQSPEFIVEEWLNSLTDDGIKIRIFLQSEDGGFVFKGTKPKSAITDQFLEKLPTGRYSLQAVGPNGKVIQRRELDVDGFDNQITAPAPMDFDKPLLALMQQSNSQLFQMLMAQQNSTMQMTIAAMTAIGGNKGGDPAQLLNAITSAMSNIKNLGGGDELDKVDKVLSIADRLGGGGSKSTGDHLMEMAKEVLPILAGGMAARAALPPAPAPPATTVSPVPPDKGKTPAEGDAGATPSPAELQRLIAQLWARLEAGADRKVDPSSVAALLLDLEAMGDPAAAVIVEIMVQIPTFEEWQKRVPIPETRRPWFEQLFASLKTFVKEGETNVGSAQNADESGTGSNRPTDATN